MERFNRFLVVLTLLVSTGLAGWIALERWQIESRNRAVELVLDYADVAQLASSSGMTVAQWLRGFQTPFSVALTEGTLEQWGAREWQGDQLSYRLSEARFQQAKQMLALRATVRLETPSDSPSVRVVSPSGSQFYVLGEPNLVAQIGLGLDPDQVEQVRLGGKPIVARLTNTLGVGAVAIRGTLLKTRQQGATLVIFAGDQVLGYRRQIETTARAFRSLGLRYGSVEFGRQAGDLQLSQLLTDRTVRVHSITAAESLLMSPREVVERFKRAVQERNIRVVYFRLASADSQQIHETLIELERALSRAGYAIREAGARPYTEWQIEPWKWLGIGFGVGVLLGWIVSQFLGWGWRVWLPVALGVGFALLCAVPAGRKVVALTSALLFPTVGMVAVAGFSSLTPNPSPTGRGESSPLLQLLRLLPIPFAWSLMGALHIVGLLAGTAFFIKVDQFAGVKITHVLPLLLVLLFYLAYALGGWRFWREWLLRPIVWGQVLLIGVVLGAVGLMLIRTGNEAPGAVPSWELQFRALLENVMNVRPRTKEFLIGHPMLVVALALLVSRVRSWLPLAMLLGAIGQVSIVNTFCHLHSPLSVSIWRVGWGILIGLALGFVLVGILGKVFALWGHSDRTSEGSGTSESAQSASEPSTLSS